MRIIFYLAFLQYRATTSCLPCQALKALDQRLLRVVGEFCRPNIITISSIAGTKRTRRDYDQERLNAIGYVSVCVTCKRVDSDYQVC